MNKKLKLFALSAVLFSGAVQAEVLDFTGGNASPYFTTDNMEVRYVDTADTTASPPGSGYANLANFTSNAWLATNRNQNSPATFSYTGSGTFALESLYVTGAWGSSDVTFAGYRNGELLFTSAVAISLTPQEVVFNWEGLDRLVITTGDRFVPDSAMFDQGYTGQFWALGTMTVTVPEPEVYTMLLAGLAIVGAVARRRRGIGRI
ncbi:MAG: PEP-CTERM sorting domain-containing protein [Azoarcus sp.]|jgi:hypothetical protein|nr:PEP-CTERM sorting domain-containing protein [Azoarcus sp.]